MATAEAWRMGSHIPETGYEGMKAALAASPVHAELATLREKLRVAEEAMTYAIWQHEGRGEPTHNHWSAVLRETLTKMKEV